VRWLFLLAYTCSGLAGLIYEVSWTRLLTLHIGHTTAAASAVVAAFMGGLAAGAAVAGRLASRLTPRQCLYAYIVFEAIVVAVALALPFEIAALAPVLRWSYRDGASGLLFPTVRLISCLVLVFVPAAALGATFPVAVRWFAAAGGNTARSSGSLYAANTAGAAVGALLAGFVLIPRIGVSGSVRVGIAGSAAAMVAALVLLRWRSDTPVPIAVETHRKQVRPPRSGRLRQRTADAATDLAADPLWVAAVALGLSGFASLMFEITWTRVFALIVGPTTYAFAATLTALIVGLALGSAAGAWIVGWSTRPAAWLAFALGAAAIATSWTCALAGSDVPRYVAQQIGGASELVDQALVRATLAMAVMVVAPAIGFGAAFPLALAAVGGGADLAPRRAGFLYAVNTIGAVAGSLVAGFVAIPQLGLQRTLWVVTITLMAAGFAVVFRSRMSAIAQIGSIALVAAAAALMVMNPAWDHRLLASGLYMYAPAMPKDVDLVTLLKAGRLLYYREGAASTVSVKRLTGTLTLAIDGKVDASNRSDMLTQEVLAHIPFLLHDDPRDVFIIGLGSGVTLASALSHPIARADVSEISPEVVEASRLFAADNRNALDDPRTHLIVGDGRSHLLLSSRRYDVILSEPSNPWIAGVASLFTREFFAAARSRLAPGGILCQWANTYRISDADLRSIVATFASVFPDGTAWLIGRDDLLLIASTAPLDPRLGNIERNWSRPGVAEDLRRVAALEPFALWSFYAGGPADLERYANGAAILTDDRMSLEFSGPRDLHRRTASAAAADLATLLNSEGAPPIVRDSRAKAGTALWRRRGAMMSRSDLHAAAFDDYSRAVTMDPADAESLEGLVRSGILSARVPEALDRVNSLMADGETAPLLVAKSKLLAARGVYDDALIAARHASAIEPVQIIALEQVATLVSDAGDAVQLDAAVAALRKRAPDHAATHYFAAVASFLRNRYDEAVASAARAIELNPQYAPVYDLIGAAYTKLGRAAEARKSFETSIGFDPHDSTAYTNLGLLELAAGNSAEAGEYFAEALSLEPTSEAAREGVRAVPRR
jgi:spermidine synthase